MGWLRRPFTLRTAETVERRHRACTRLKQLGRRRRFSFIRMAKFGRMRAVPWQATPCNRWLHTNWGLIDLALRE